MDIDAFIAAVEAVDSPQDVDRYLAGFLEALARGLDHESTKLAIERALARYRETGRLPLPVDSEADPVYLWLLRGAYSAAEALRSGEGRDNDD